jgi:hypothetical protein
MYMTRFRNPAFGIGSEPEFLNILKCNSAETVSAGFQFNFLDIFNDKINTFCQIFNFVKIYTIE